MNAIALMARCEDYLAQRSGTYEFRKRRYEAVGKIIEPRLSDDDTLFDVGACMTEFDYHMRTELDWRGRYIPVDGAIDGTDLEEWRAPRIAEWFVGIEIIEHLHDPLRLIVELQANALKGVVLTTPNPEVVDVLAIDYTHVTPVHEVELTELGFHVVPMDLFGEDGDTLLAWWSPPA